jgi:phospholipase/carboxylesterase
MTTELQRIILEPTETPDASVIWLHGLGADGHDFEAIVPELALAPGHGVRFIFPHAPIRPITINGGMEMRAWYDISDTGLERQVDESGIRESAQAIAALVDHEVDNGIASNRIILAGFSQGGVIALHLGLRYPHRLAGILALSTYLSLPETLAEEADPVQQKLHIFIGHGTQDPMVPETHGSRSAQLLRSADYLVEYQTYPMQHAVSPAEIHDVSAWIKQRLETH